MQTSLRVGRNDPALAHGIATQIIEKASRRSGWDHFGEFKYEKSPMRAFKARFGADILTMRVEKPHGARAKWQAFVIDACDLNGELNYSLVYWQMRGGVLNMERFAWVTPHAVARVLQRRVGVADPVQIEAEVRKLFLAVVSVGHDEISREGDVRIADRHGVWVGTGVDNGRFRFATYIDADSDGAAPWVKALCSRVEDDSHFVMMRSDTRDPAKIRKMLSAKTNEGVENV